MDKINDGGPPSKAASVEESVARSLATGKPDAETVVMGTKTWCMERHRILTNAVERFPEDWLEKMPTLERIAFEAYQAVECGPSNEHMTNASLAMAKAVEHIRAYYKTTTTPSPSKPESKPETVEGEGKAKAVTILQDILAHKCSICSEPAVGYKVFSLIGKIEYRCDLHFNDPAKAPPPPDLTQPAPKASGTEECECGHAYEMHYESDSNGSGCGVHGCGCHEFRPKPPSSEIGEEWLPEGMDMPYGFGARNGMLWTTPTIVTTAVKYRDSQWRSALRAERERAERAEKERDAANARYAKYCGRG